MRALLATYLLCGCAAQHPEVGSARPSSPPAPARARACTRVTGAAIGALPLEVTVGTSTVSLAEWTVADERSMAVVGFAAQMPADVSFTVQAGADEFHGRGARWLHPAGVSGPKVHALESITFCQQAPASAGVTRLALK